MNEDFHNSVGDMIERDNEREIKELRLKLAEANRLLSEERERCAKVAESQWCACKAEDLHDGCCGGCGNRIAEAIRKGTKQE